MTPPVPAVPFQDHDAERCVLGAILLNQDTLISAVSILGDDPEVFHQLGHQHIYSAVLDLYRDQEHVDLVTITTRLTAAKTLQDAGGAAYLATLTDSVQTSHSAAVHARIVRESSRKRMASARLKRAQLEIQQGVTPDTVLQNLLEFMQRETDKRLTISSLLDWRELSTQPVDTVFYEGLPTGKLGVLAAAGGTGKSFFALQLAISVALGRDVIAGFTPTQEGRVLCCFGEDDDLIVSQRMAAISDALGIHQKDIHGALQFNRLQFINGQSSPLLAVDAFGGITRTPAFLELLDTCRREKYRLIIIDPLVSWAGIPNENDNAAMQMVAQALITIAEASGGAVLTLHHANKVGSRTADLSQTTSRGASSLLDAARWVASMRGLTPKDAERYGIDADEAHRYMEVFVSKNSYAERSGQVNTMLRVKGGALRPVDLKADKEERVAHGIVTALEKMPEKGGLTRREMCRGDASMAEKFRASLNEIMGFKVSREWLEKALIYGFTNNLLVEKTGEKRGSGRPRDEVFVSEF